MSLTNQSAAYRDCYELYNRAVATPGGIRTPIGTRTEALYFQMRMNQARVILRDQSRAAYPFGHHLHNTSEYDSYKVQVLEDSAHEWWVYVRFHGNWSAVLDAEPIPIEEQAVLPPSDATPTQAQLTYEDHDAQSEDLQ